MIVMKYVERESGLRSDHWDFCEKNGLPFVEISVAGDGWKRIFFDVTNYDVDLEDISNKVRHFYRAYADFFLLSVSDVRECLEQYYFFSMLIKSGHADFIANGLYDFLASELQKNK